MCCDLFYKHYHLIFTALENKYIILVISIYRFKKDLVICQSHTMLKLKAKIYHLGVSSFLKFFFFNFNKIYWLSLIASGLSLAWLTGFVWPCFWAAATVFKALFCFFSF